MRIRRSLIVEGLAQPKYVWLITLYHKYFRAETKIGFPHLP